MKKGIIRFFKATSPNCYIEFSDLGSNSNLMSKMVVTANKIPVEHLLAIQSSEFTKVAKRCELAPKSITLTSAVLLRVIHARLPKSQLQLRGMEQVEDRPTPANLSNKGKDSNLVLISQIFGRASSLTRLDLAGSSRLDSSKATQVLIDFELK